MAKTAVPIQTSPFFNYLDMILWQFLLQVGLSSAQYSLTSAESWPKTPFISSFHSHLDPLATGFVGQKLRIKSLLYEDLGVSGREKAVHQEWWPFQLNLTDNPSDYVIHSPGLTGEEGTVSFESFDFPGYYLGIYCACYFGNLSCLLFYFPGNSIGIYHVCCHLGIYSYYSISLATL